MNPLHPQLIKAAELGKAAFEKGLPPGTFYCPEILVMGRTKEVPLLDIMDAYNKAWHRANLDAPVIFSDGTTLVLG